MKAVTRNLPSIGVKVRGARMTLAAALVAMALSLAPGGAAAQGLQPVAKNTIGGMTAVALLTTDDDWREKWKAAGDEPPNFNASPVLEIGQKATLLVFFSVPDFDLQPVEIECDLQLFQNDTMIEEVPPTPCFSSRVEGDPARLFLTGMVVGVAPDPGDEGAVVRFRIGVRDVARDIRVPVTVGYTTAGAAPAK